MKVPSGLLLLALPAAMAYPCAAQPYPSRVIELVSPTGPGGGSDLVARIVADIGAKEKLLPHLFVVQNRACGEGAVGRNYVAGRQGDPYTGLLAGLGLLTLPIRTGLDARLNKFQPLGMIGAWRATCMRIST